MGKTSLMRWLVPLGLGLLLVVMAVAGVLALDRGWLFGVSQVPAPTPGPGPIIAGPTAQEAFASASEVAGAWQEDARLAALRAHWPDAGRGHRDEIGWAFQFFSPSTGRLALFAVDEGGARRLRERLSPYEVRLIPAEQWRVDSDEALGAWWRHGGDYLLARRADTEITLRLSMPDGGDPRPVWVVTGSLPGHRDMVVAKVDAVDGTLLGD